MDSALRTISYIADIGSIVVLMARQRMSQASSEDFSSESPDSASEGTSQYRMICYVFESEDVSFRPTALTFFYSDVFLVYIFSFYIFFFCSVFI